MMRERLYTAAQTAALDRRAIDAFGIPGFQLMQAAADAAFQAMHARWPGMQRMAVLCGSGNNGGDGFLVAVQARAAGIETRLYLLGERASVRGDAARALAAFETDGGLVEAFTGSLPEATDVVVDALLGTGLARPVASAYRQAVAAINAAGEAGAGVFAIDIPSGLDADTGAIWGVAVHADATATFIARKLGLYTGVGPAYVGTVLFHDLDMPAAAYEAMAYRARLVDGDEAAAALPRRARDCHKGHNGQVLCVGGNQGMGGAVRLAAEAALRVGAGLVSVATRPDHVAAMTQARPELMCRGIGARADGLGPLLDSASVVALGPGLGQDAWARALFARILETTLPLVVDADALNLLAAEPVARGHWVLTPHPGEAGRLLGSDAAAVQADRPAAAEELARRYNAGVVLKGAGSLIAGVDDGLWLASAGNPGMAVGGMGDLLTGVIAGLIAQGLPLARGARVGVFLHGSAGDAAALDGERGLLPSDCLALLRRLANPA